MVGGGGFGRELAQYAVDTGRFRLKGVLDDRAGEGFDSPHGLEVLGTISGYEIRPGQVFLLAVGNPETRQRIVERYEAAGAVFESVIHPLAYVASTAKLGRGIVVAPFATVGASATVSDFVQVHFYASVAHDTITGPFAALSPYSVVNGGGKLEECVFLGTRATVNPGKRVGAHSRVAAGSVVYRDVPAGSIASGNPAKSRRMMGTSTLSSGEA